MAIGEFSLIEKYFSKLGGDAGVALGVGDDCALLNVPPGQQLAATVDTLVAGVHFPEHANPADIAHRALRVNLSDLAAMGAAPRWFTLALTLPESNEAWLSSFSQALAMDASAFGCALVGGDTTAGPLSISINMFGLVAKGEAMIRSGASAGDAIYVTGTLGDGAAAVWLLTDNNSDAGVERERLLEKFYRPQPRLAEGNRLRGIASAAIDISDGLLADLGHIASRSGLAAEVEADLLPIDKGLYTLADKARVRDWALTGGDDYELCFTVPAKQVEMVDMLIAMGELPASRIGQMMAGSGVCCIDAQGNKIEIERKGYQHF